MDIYSSICHKNKWQWNKQSQTKVAAAYKCITSYFYIPQLDSSTRASHIVQDILTVSNPFLLDTDINEKNIVKIHFPLYLNEDKIQGITWI